MIHTIDASSSGSMSSAIPARPLSSRNKSSSRITSSPKCARANFLALGIIQTVLEEGDQVVQVL